MLWCSSPQMNIFPHTPSACISSRNHPHSLIPLENLLGLSFPSCVSVAGEICHLNESDGTWEFFTFFFFLMKKEDSLLLPLVSLKSLPSARRFMRPQSPRNNMRKSWSEGCSRSRKHAVQRSSGLGKCGCVEWISWGVCALLRRTH